MLWNKFLSLKIALKFYQKYMKERNNTKKNIPFEFFPFIRRKKLQLAFTFIELIVLIIVLAILWTIAFISLQWYSAQSRDSVRISDMTSMKTWLELFNLETWKYPLPTQWTDITYSWAVVWIQWYFWETVFVNVNKLNKIPTDPTTDKMYVYSTTSTRWEFQLAQAMEWNEISVNSEKWIIDNVLTTEKTARLKISWTFNGKVIKVSSWSLNCLLALPSIVASTWTTLENILSNNLLAYNWYKNLPFQYTWVYNTKWESALKLVNYTEIKAYCWTDFNVLYEQTLTWSLARKTMVENLQKAYTWTSIDNMWPIQSILLTDINNNDATEILSTNIVSNNLWRKIVANFTSNWWATWTFNLSQTTVNQWTNVTISHTCSQVPTSYTSSNTSVATISWTIITTLWVGTTNITPVWWACADNTTKTLTVNLNLNLINETNCTRAWTWWIWVPSANDVYIWTIQWNGFCISPRIWDFWDSTWQCISWNGWWNFNNWDFKGWDASSTGIRDTWNSPNYTYGQTKTLDSSIWYTCKSIWSSATDYDNTLWDTLIWRMKWLNINKVNLAELQNIEWVQNANPPNNHPIPVLYIADCIDWIKDLWTTMTYKHNNNTTENITYAQYSTDVLSNTDTANLSGTIYQNKQKYLTAWTQKSGSHLPSAMSYITSWYASASDSDWDFLNWNDRWEYQVSCEANLLKDSDQTSWEWIWLSALGNTNGANWGRNARVIGSVSCGDQANTSTGYRGGNTSARFVVRP